MSISNDSFIHLFITRCQYFIPKIYNILFDLFTIREIVTFYDRTSQEMFSQKYTKHHLIITTFGTILGNVVSTGSNILTIAIVCPNTDLACSDLWTAQAGDILILKLYKKKFNLASVCPVLIWPVLSCSVPSWTNLICPVLTWPVMSCTDLISLRHWP